MKIKLVPRVRGRQYECFACGTEFVTPFRLERCMRCEEDEEFYEMR